MTKTRIAKAAAALILASMAGLAAAGGTQQINVTATVSTVCKFTTGAAIAMDFGAIDPSGSADVIKTISVPYQCTKGTADAAVASYTGGTSLSDGTNSMSYSLDPITSSGPGAGFAAAATTFSVTGRITAAQYQNAVASAGYKDTVVLTINH